MILKFEDITSEMFRNLCWLVESKENLFTSRKQGEGYATSAWGRIITIKKVELQEMNEEELDSSILLKVTVKVLESYEKRHEQLESPREAVDRILDCFEDRFAII